MTTKAEVLAAIGTAPEGLTTQELAERLGRPRYSVGSIASKLHAYGIIGRTVLDRRGTSRWRPKEAQS